MMSYVNDFVNDDVFWTSYVRLIYVLYLLGKFDESINAMVSNTEEEDADKFFLVWWNFVRALALSPTGSIAGDFSSLQTLTHR